tara:strand:+ start:2341 stop:3021 length:681 start_codon:yes stop_codon:yes gene_type:complete
MSYGSNGGVIGPENTPTTDAASGVWSLGELAEAERDSLWPAPNYSDLFVIQTSTSTAASLTFASIPQTYKHLWFVWTIPGASSNWGNFYSYAQDNPVPNYSASAVWYQSNSSLGADRRGPQGTGYGLKMASGDDSVYSTSVQYHDFMWPYYSDAQSSGATTRWPSAIGSGYSGKSGSPSSFTQYLTAWNLYGGGSTIMPITELTVKFGDGTALPSGTTRTLYGISA